MTTEATPGALGSNDQLGPNALDYARARVSLLGAQEHMDTLNRALDALDGLPGAALIGGWTFKGFTAWAQGLEAELAELRTAQEARWTEAPEFETIVALKSSEQASLSPGAYQVLTNAVAAGRQKAMLPAVHGVYCCAENPNALTVVFKRRPTDDELRNLHDLVRAHGA